MLDRSFLPSPVNSSSVVFYRSSCVKISCCSGFAVVWSINCCLSCFGLCCLLLSRGISLPVFSCLPFVPRFVFHCSFCFPSLLPIDCSYSVPFLMFVFVTRVTIGVRLVGAPWCRSPLYSLYCCLCMFLCCHYVDCLVLRSSLCPTQLEFGNVATQHVLLTINIPFLYASWSVYVLLELDDSLSLRRFLPSVIICHSSISLRPACTIPLCVHD